MWFKGFHEAMWIKGNRSKRRPTKSKKKKTVLPTPGIEPGPRRWERRILTTRPYGKRQYWKVKYKYLNYVTHWRKSTCQIDGSSHNNMNQFQTMLKNTHGVFPFWICCLFISFNVHSLALLVFPASVGQIAIRDKTASNQWKCSSKRFPSVR